MAEIVVLEAQSLFDLVIQECGGIGAAFEIAELNGLSITDVLVPGTSIELPETINKPVHEYYKTHGLKPSTDATTISELINEGIDFWALEVDFVVQ